MNIGDLVEKPYHSGWWWIVAIAELLFLVPLEIVGMTKIRISIESLVISKTVKEDSVYVNPDSMASVQARRKLMGVYNE